MSVQDTLLWKRLEPILTVETHHLALSALENLVINPDPHDASQIRNWNTESGSSIMQGLSWARTPVGGLDDPAVFWNRLYNLQRHYEHLNPRRER